MRKIDELNSPSSCMSRARDAEWVFVLLERDITAAGTVGDWIDRRIEERKNQRTDAQIIEAEDWIEQVVKENPKSVLGIRRSQLFAIINLADRVRCAWIDEHGPSYDLEKPLDAAMAALESAMVDLAMDLPTFNLE